MSAKTPGLSLVHIISGMSGNITVTRPTTTYRWVNKRRQLALWKTHLLFSVYANCTIGLKVKEKNFNCDQQGPEVNKRDQILSTVLKSYVNDQMCPKVTN